MIEKVLVTFLFFLKHNYICFYIINNIKLIADISLLASKKVVDILCGHLSR